VTRYYATNAFPLDIQGRWTFTGHARPPSTAIMRVFLTFWTRILLFVPKFTSLNLTNSLLHRGFILTASVASPWLRKVSRM